MVNEYAASPMAKRRIDRMKPQRDIDVIRKLQEETNDALNRLNRHGNISFSGLRDIGASIKRLEVQGTLTSQELLDIAAVLQVAKAVKQYGDGSDLTEALASRNQEPVSQTTNDSLTERFNMLLPLEHIASEITRCILSENEYADDASSGLKNIRREIRLTNDKLHQQLDKIIKSDANRDQLQDSLITMRNGRYCIPVKQEYRSKFPGMIHDQSSTGSTLFIEPMAVVNLNNQIKELANEELLEIEKILETLSAQAATYVSDIAYDLELLTDLDFIFAKAKFARATNSTRPIFNTDGIIDIRQGRHPLLEKHSVVPVDIRLGEAYNLLIITGPNTGGKTVSLKTLGLFSLMGQAGLHIPAMEESRLAVFDDIFADIGDEQSIEQSLSTFSAHMVNIVDIMQRVTPKALVLFDELGAGTDPIEGAALAEAILEKIRRIGCLCAATTHYAELKAYALDTEGVSNASCEFSLETLKPTYKLTIGLPGRSNAFAIAERLGISGDIIGNAKGYISGESRRFEQILTELENTRSVLEDEKSAVKRLRAELETSRAEAREQRERLNKRLEETERKAEREAQKMVDSARASAEYIFAELDRAKRAKDKEDFAKTLEEAKQNVTQGLRSANKALGTKSVRAEDEEYKPPRPFKVGDEVIISGINKNGTILSIDGESVTVQAGIIKTKTKLKELRLAEDFPEKKEKTPKVRSYATASASPSATIRAEIDLRGMMCDDAWMKVDKYIDEAVMANLPQITIIHGKGTGALRNYITQSLRRDKRVASFRPGTFGEGDSGVTVVTLK